MTDQDLERALALDATPGPALPVGASHADAIIDAALAGAGFGPGGGPDGGSAGSGGATGKTAAGTKLAIVGGAAIVAVAIVLLVGRGRHRGDEAAVPPADAAIPDERGGSGSLAVTDEPPAAPAQDASTEPADEITIDTPAKPKPVKSVTKPSAADLLGEANAKRAAKQWRDSDRLYTRVVDRAPKSLAAQSALIASASLHLEHFHDPKGAAQRLRKALAIAPSGGLAEEARWGLAEAARALHDRKAEATALDDFLAHHASSPLAPRAKARRAELP